MKHLRSIVAIYFLALFWASACASDVAFRLRVESSSGKNSKSTCFPVGKHELMTVAHAVADAEEITVEQESGWLRCKVVRIDADADLALLECKYAEFKPLPVSPINTVAGAALKFYGSPAGGAIREFACKLLKWWTYPDGKGKAFVCDVAAVSGCSGSPVMSAAKVVGVVRAMDKADDAAICVPCERVTKFLCEDDTFAGEIIPPPKDALPKAEIVALPPVPTWPELPAAQTCKHCQKVQVKTPISISSKRHWEEDAYGQGHYVFD